MAKGQHQKEREKKPLEIKLLKILNKVTDPLKAKLLKLNEDKKKKWNVINVAAMASVFVAVTISLLVFERPTVSQTEKRELEKFPEFNAENLFSGKFTSGVSAWFNDTVPWRDGFKDVSANINKHMGIALDGVKIYNVPSTVVRTTAAENDPPSTTENTNSTAPALTTSAESNENVSDTASEITEATTSDIVTTTEPAVTEPPYDPRNEIAPGVQTNGQIVFQQNGHYRAVSLYGGGFNRDTFVESVNAFADDLDGVSDVYVMIAPTQGEYYTPKNFEQYNASQSEDIYYIADHLSDKVTNVDCVEALWGHVTEEIYTRTDHHWQPLGAFYAAEQFAKAAGIEFPALETYDKREIEGFVGSQYTYTQSAELLNDPEVFTYYIPANDFKTYYYDTSYNFDDRYPFFLEMPVKSAYGTFMGGDQKIVRVETDVKNGKRLAVFKDSYGNAEIPFYMNGYEEIFVCDIRYFDLNAIEFVKEHEIDDVLFTMCTFSAAGVNSEDIEKIRTQ